jgi:hypothetical protein
LTYGSGRTCSIIEELVFPFLFWKPKAPVFMLYSEGDCKALFTISELTTT